ncbi:MAG: methyltransferase [Burkholderiaceae bacterium]
MIVAALQGALRSASDWLMDVTGRPVRRRSADRQYLEHEVLPALARRADVRCVLFVGCARYTRHYEAMFPKAEYWTIDPDPHRQRWGARRHIVDRLERLGHHRSEAHFDLIVCNGVLGWGLDARDDAEAAFAACHAALRPGGQLILGWNDIRPHNAVRPDGLESLGCFERAPASSGRPSQVRIGVPHRHVFEFYRKPGGTEVQGISVVGASGAGAHDDSGSQAPSTHSS